MARFSAEQSPEWGGDPAELIEQLGAELAARYGQAEQDMIVAVASRIERGLEVDDVTRDRIRILGELREQGEQIAAELADPDLVDQIIAVAAEDGQAAAAARLGIGGRLETTSGVTGTAANAVAQIAIDLASSLDDMTARITRWMPDAYQRVVSMFASGTILGVETIRDTQRRAASAFLARGVTGFTDTAGREWRIGTYAEMATRTAVNRAWQSANIAQLQSQGINLVTIVIGVDACKVCAAHAGKVWSTDGTPGGTYTVQHAIEDREIEVTVAGTLDQARAGGWNHPNCRCVVVGYFAGLRITGSTYDPQAEQDRDRLRTLERRVRDLKRREAATFDDVTKARLRRRIRAAQADIREHVAETGQMRKNYREQLAFSDGART